MIEDQQLEPFLRELLNAFHEVAVWSVADQEGRLLYVNPKFCQISGFSKEELLKQKYKILNSGYHSKQFFSDLWRTITKGNTWRGEIRNKRKDGDIFWVDTMILPLSQTGLRQEGVAQAAYVSFCFDITDRKLMEMALEEERAKNMHLSRLSALGEMAGGIAHEVNNPLAIINGMLFQIERQMKNCKDLGEAETIAQSIQKAQVQIKRIGKIVNGLREFSHSGEGTGFDLTSVQSIFEVVEGLCAQKIKEQGVRYQQTGGSFDFTCNKVQIEQVLVNLLSNAIDAIQNQQEKWIQVEARQVGDFVEFRVMDSGKGIDPELLQKIMQPFFTTKEVGKGTGLGLSISRTLVERHGGTLFVEKDCPNTCFVVQIPRTSAALLDLLDADQAIGNHLGWRQQILSAVQGQQRCLIDPEKISKDNLCALGKWIHKIEPRFQKQPSFEELKFAHAEFHKCAGDLARLACAGDASVTDLSFGSGSDYDRLSHRIIVALQKLKASGKRMPA